MKQKIRFRMRYTNAELRYVLFESQAFSICPEPCVTPGAMNLWVEASGMYEWPQVGRRVSQ